MLRLRLSRGSDVFIGDDIKIVVLNVYKGTDQIELGFQAPKELKILRGHLYRNQKSPKSGSPPPQPESSPPQE